MQMLWCLHFMLVHNEFHLPCGGPEHRVDVEATSCIANICKATFPLEVDWSMGKRSD